MHKLAVKAFAIHPNSIKSRRAVRYHKGGKAQIARHACGGGYAVIGSQPQQNKCINTCMI